MPMHFKPEVVLSANRAELRRLHAMASEYKARFGARIRRARTAKGLSQPQLARLLPDTVDASTISRWETGKVLPGTDYQELLAGALDVDVSYFYSEEPQPDTADLMGAFADTEERIARIESSVIELGELVVEVLRELRGESGQRPGRRRQRAA